MDRNEWENHPDPDVMLRTLGQRAGERKLRLFFVACGRAGWSQEILDDYRTVLEIAERVADGDATSDELVTQARALSRSWFVSDGSPDFIRFVGRNIDAWGIAKCSSYERFDPAEWLPSIAWRHGRRFADPHVPSLLRCIFGNPFRPVALDPSWRTEAVVALAAGIYADRAFDRLPILADALDDAGCANPDVLAHCRSAGPHARGCWVVDLLLGKT